MDFWPKMRLKGISVISSATMAKKASGARCLSTDRKNGPFLGRFGSKIDVSRNKNDIFFRVFAIFEDFLRCKPLQIRN